MSDFQLPPIPAELVEDLGRVIAHPIPAAFDFHSSEIEDRCLVSLFDGNDGHTYCLTVNLRNPLAPSTFVRVD